MKDYWSEIKYFKPHEFDSPDLPGSGIWMDENLIKIIDQIRGFWGEPLHVNSAYRTPAHNEKVGGVKNSQHAKHKAVDLHIDSQEMGDFIEKYAIDLGIGGVGRYNTFIHLDTGRRRYWDKRSV